MPISSSVSLTGNISELQELFVSNELVMGSELVALVVDELLLLDHGQGRLGKDGVALKEE